MLNTRAGEFLNSNDVVNSNDLRKHLLSVDSRFRSNYGETSASFAYALPHPYKNVIRLRLASVEIPNTFYAFTEQNNSFTIKARDILSATRLFTITISPGNYTAAELVTAIQAQFDSVLRDPYGLFFTIALDPPTNKITITHTGIAVYPVTGPNPVPSDSANPFDITFASLETFEYQYTNFGLGHNLGYRMPSYHVTNAVTTSPSPLTTYVLPAEALINVNGANYLLLCVNDFQTVEHKTDKTYLQPLAKIIVRQQKNTVIYDDGASFMSNDIIFPSPQDVKHLIIKVLDPYGKVVDLNGAEISLTLEITEVLNTRLYDFYRNYIWLGSVPTIKKPQGSAVPLLGGMGGVGSGNF
jgi:hypothetical protein